MLAALAALLGVAGFLLPGPTRGWLLGVFAVAAGATAAAAWRGRSAGRWSSEAPAAMRRPPPAPEAIDPELAATAAQFLEIARRIAHVDAGAVYRLEAGGAFQMIVERGATAAELVRLRSWPLEGSHVGEAVRAGRLVVTDLTQSPLLGDDLRAAVVAAGYRTLFALPISTETGAWGALVLVSSETRQLTGDETALLEAVAVQIGHAVSRAALAAEAREKGRRLETLARLTQTLTATLPLDEVLRRVVDTAVQIFGASESRLWLLDGDGGGLSLGAASGSATGEARGHPATGEGLVDAIVARRAPLVVPDLGRDRRVRNAERARAAELVSFAGVPVMLGERIVAVLTIASRQRHEYTGEEIGLLESLAHHAAVVIDDARRFEEEQTRRAHLAALLDITKRIGAAESTDALLRTIADEAARLLQVDNAGFRLVEGDELVVAGLAGTADQTMLRPRIKIGESFSGRVVKEGRTIATSIARVGDLLPEHRAADERLGYTEFLGVPLRAGQRIIGVLAFRARRPFTARQRELAETFADQAAVALENARLFALEHTRRAQIETLAEIEREFAAELNLDRLLRLVVDRAGRLFGARGGIFLVQGGRTLVPRASNERAFYNRPLPFGHGISGACAEERRGFLVNDYAASPHALPDFVASGVRRLLAHPLILRDSLLGVISLARTGEDAPPFTPEDLAVLESFATQATIAIENARLHEEGERRRAEAEALAALAKRLTESLELSAVGERIVQSLRALLHVRLAGLRLLQPDGSLVAVAWDGEGGDQFELGHVQAPATGLAARSVSEGRAVWSADLLQEPSIHLDPEMRQWLLDSELRAALAVPLQTKGRIVGVLIVGDEATRAFTDAEIALVQAFADHAALALENARLHEETERRAKRLRALANVNRLVSSSLDTGEVLGTIARAAAELTGSPFVGFFVADEHSETLRISAVSDDGMGADFPLATLAFGEGATGWVAAQRRALNIPDVFADERYRAREWSTRHGVTSFYGVPILLHDTLLGVLSMGGRAPFHFTPDEESLLESFAAQAAVALQHARLYDETARRLGETRALLEVAEILNSTLDPQQLLNRAAVKIAEVCRVDRCSIQRWDGHRVVPLMAQFADGREDAEMWTAFTRLASSPPWPALDRAAETRRPLVVDDVAETDQVPQEWVEILRCKSCMLVPLLRQDQVIGFLGLDCVERTTPFQAWQIALATAVAGQLALALENIRLFTEAQERLRETTTLLAVGHVLSLTAPVEEVLRLVLRELVRALGADMGGAYVLDERGEALRPVAGYRVPEALREWFVSHPMVLARLPRLLDDWRAGRASFSPDTQADHRFDSEWVRRMPPHAVLFAPTQVRSESRGALFLVWWRTGREFPPAETRLMEGVAAQVGLALENAELARQREIRFKETETLLVVSRALASTLDLGMLLRHFMRQINKAIGAEVIGVWMLDESGERMVPKAGYRVPPEWMPAMASLRLSIVDDPFYAEAARTKRAVFARDVTTDPRFRGSAVADMPHRSQLFVPILAKGRLIAGFAAVWLEQSRDFSPGELALTEAIAHQAGVALDNAHLFEQNRRQVEELTVLHELSRAVTGQLDEQALLEAIRLQLPRVLVVDTFVMFLVTDQADELEVALRVEDGQVDTTSPRRYPPGTGLASVILETGRPLRTQDYAGEAARRGLRLPAVVVPPCWLGVPMMAGSSVLGVLAVSRRQGAFTDAEERLTASIADLAALALRSARLYEERTRAYGELAAAQDHLVRTEKLRALGEMASGVAHDFNNLLAAILGRAQLLLRRIDDPRLRQWLQVIERSALDGAQTVRRLQEFARVRRDEPLVPVDLNEVVCDALDITQSRWREESLRRGIMIDVQTRLEVIPPVAGDAAELREVMTNLILNAVDAMPDGGTLTLASTTADGKVQLTVSDTGVGIPEAIRERIFDPFFTTKGPQGTGLGLSMSYGILSRHGAQITVESQEGHGSRFCLLFSPVAVQATPPEEAPAPAIPVGAMRCLVLDDEEAVGAVIGDVLETLGHQAVVLSDGAQALERFRAEPFDVVFTDLAMPGLSGWQVARAVKDLAPTVPVFVVTGFGVALSAEERRAHGVEAIFSKPLRIEDVVDAMEQVARKRPGRSVAEDP